MKEMNLKDLLQVFRKRWWIVLVITFLTVITSIVFSFYILEPTYQSSTVIYVGKNIEDKSTVLTTNDLTLGDKLIEDYRELVKSRLISELVIKELNLSNLTTELLKAKVNVSPKNDTRFILISAADGSPELARDIANTMAIVFKEKVFEVMKIENVQIIDTAQLPEYPIKPNKRKNVAIALMLGLVLGFGVIFALEYFDDTLKTPEDVQKYLELPVIGTIPSFPEQYQYKSKACKSNAPMYD